MKTCEIKPYIQLLTSDLEEQNRLNEIHNNIFDELHQSKLYRLFKGTLYEKNSVDALNKGRLKFKEINDRYGAKVTFSEIYKGGLRLKVNVSPLLIESKEFTQEELDAQEYLKNDEPYVKYSYKNTSGFEILNENDLKEELGLYQKVSDIGSVVSEKTIRDLAARMSDRIGIPFQIISDRTEEYKGKLEGNTAVINLAYATLDTIFHEVAAHPIIRTLKMKSKNSINSEIEKMIEIGIIKKEC